MYLHTNLDIKNNKISSLSILDQIEDEVDAKFTALDKLTKALNDFTIKVEELEDYKYLLFKAREIFHSKKSEGDIELGKYSFQPVSYTHLTLPTTPYV